MVKGSSRSRLLVGLTAVVAVVTACTGTTPAASSAAPTTAASQAASGGASAPAGSSGGGKQYVIGYSNGGGVGNGFREEQVCTAKAQAKASGQVSNLIVKHRNTDAAGQASDIRDLVSAGVQAIVFNPNDPSALNPALQAAHDAGIKTVSVDAYVTDANTWNLYNNQIKYAELGAKWLFDQLGGKGTVWYTRGLAGHPADSDRDIGFKNVLKNYPNIKVVPNNDGVFTGWDPAKATQITNDFLSSGQYDKIDGIWASGMGSAIVDAIKAANKPFKPIADADIGAFVKQLLDPTNYPGLKGAAVTNTASVGGAGITLALKLLNGEQVQADPNAGRANTVLLDPVIVDNTTPQGQQQLKDWISVPGMDPLWPLSLSIQGWTTYDPNTVPSSCKGA
ncbi:MAG TPA: substrate-binding domain-containing protein [Candidatus Limnocylindrales bacterium]|nr:substrate-binding domain-containing protein [Candidatus Limnocylindrales bacterium]